MNWYADVVAPQVGQAVRIQLGKVGADKADTAGGRPFQPGEQQNEVLREPDGPAMETRLAAEMRRATPQLG